MEFSNIIEGKNVRHTKFGDGIVEKINGETIIIRFSAYDEQKQIKPSLYLMEKNILAFEDEYINNMVLNELNNAEKREIAKKIASKINCFYFFHYNTTYKYSLENNCIITSEYNINGVSNSSKKHMELVKVNDLFFHSLDTDIVAISFAESVAESIKFPKVYLEHFSGDKGLIIKTKLILLDKPLPQETVKKIITNCVGEKPFDKNDNGKPVVCSIYEDKKNAKQLLQAIVSSNPCLIENELVKEFLEA